ncbi:MAG TPA: tetraacyldisaccharide 4'-kinase, partial [Acetobacteraceae bacterium]|nr:tetraacyldisaccharide 4'-kinase [Acetobacteraceae bacterium]
MRAPLFWQRDGVLPALLSPLAALWAVGAARRTARPGWRAPARVICCGNATVGGAGKTTLALDLGARLQRRGQAVAFLTRGYGGHARGVLRVDPSRHGAALVGDEPLLLAACAPTYVAADRAAGARAAIAEGARVLVMDDGLQNPTLAKDVSLLVIDGAAGFGNGRVLPAGPLREKLAAAAARCRAAVLIGTDRRGALARLPPGLTVLRAHLAPDGPPLAGRRMVAFAGIGRPDKFFDMLAANGADLVARHPFPDHHPFTDAELRAVFDAASRLGAVPVTTPKDAARLSPEERARVIVC